MKWCKIVMRSIMVIALIVIIMLHVFAQTIINYKLGYQEHCAINETNILLSQQVDSTKEAYYLGLEFAQRCDSRFQCSTLIIRYNSKDDFEKDLPEYLMRYSFDESAAAPITYYPFMHENGTRNMGASSVRINKGTNLINSYFCVKGRHLTPEPPMTFEDDFVKEDFINVITKYTDFSFWENNANVWLQATYVKDSTWEVTVRNGDVVLFEAFWNKKV